MDKTIAGLIGAVGALAVAAPAGAAVSQPPTVAAAMEAHSYSDLLKPIPNAVEVLKASAAVPESTGANPDVKQAQVWLYYGRRPYYHHHHHHHHHHRYYHHHHHHHHHHHNQ